jgi:hypothetical protein
VIEDISLKAPICIGTFTPDGENEANFFYVGCKKEHPNKWIVFKIKGFFIQQIQSTFT